MADEPGTSGELHQQPWYHGLITRIQAEATVKNEGEFLVRDSISSPGGFVLTARWKKRSLHFQVNCTVENGKKTFHFEEEQFGSVVDLILFYLSHKRPVTLSSGTLLLAGAKKTDSVASTPSKDLEAAYMHVFRPGEERPAPSSLGRQVLVTQASLRQLGPRTLRPVSSFAPEVPREPVPPPPASLLNRPLPLPIRSPRTSKDDGEDYCEMDYDAMEDILDASLSYRNRSGSVQSLPQQGLSRQFQSCVNLRAASPAPMTPPALPSRPPLPPRPTNLGEKKIPPLPAYPLKSRTPTEEARDSAFVDYDELRPKNDDYDRLPTTSSDYDRLPTTNYDVLNKRLSGGSDSDVSERSSPRRDSGIYSSPSPPNETSSLFCPAQTSQLKLFILNRKAGEVAESISYEDVKMLKFLGLSEKAGLGADNGLRQVLLPQGAVLRRDLLTRCRHLQWAVVVSVASSGRTDAPRVLRQWVLIAEHLLSKHGNIFGFANVMAALDNKMLQSQSHLFSKLDMHSSQELKSLRSVFLALKQGDESQMSATVIPFLQPVLEIFGTAQTQYLDESSFASEIDSMWRWLDAARRWSRDADGLRDAARGRFVRSRAAAENPLADQNLKRLCCLSQSSLTDAVQKLLSEC